MTHVARAIAAVALVAAVACKGRDAAPAWRGDRDRRDRSGARGRHRGIEGAQGGGRDDREALGENKLITEPTFQFAPADTVYVSVSTEGAAGERGAHGQVALPDRPDGGLLDPDHQADRARRTPSSTSPIPRDGRSGPTTSPSSPTVIRWTRRISR